MLTFSFSITRPLVAFLDPASGDLHTFSFTDQLHESLDFTHLIQSLIKAQISIFKSSLFIEIEVGRISISLVEISDFSVVISTSVEVEVIETVSASSEVDEAISVEFSIISVISVVIMEVEDAISFSVVVENVVSTLVEIVGSCVVVVVIEISALSSVEMLAIKAQRVTIITYLNLPDKFTVSCCIFDDNSCTCSDAITTDS